MKYIISNLNLTLQKSNMLWTNTSHWQNFQDVLFWWLNRFFAFCIVCGFLFFTDLSSTRKILHVWLEHIRRRYTNLGKNRKVCRKQRCFQPRTSWFSRLSRNSCSWQEQRKSQSKRLLLSPSSLSAGQGRKKNNLRFGGSIYKTLNIKHQTPFFIEEWGLNFLQ